MNILKKLGASFYIGAFAFITALIGLIVMCVSNSTPGYGLDNFGTGIALAAVALVVIATSVAAGFKFGNQNPATAVFRVAAVLLAMFAAGVVISGRVVLLSSLMTFDSNEVGWSAFNTSLTAVIFIVISVISVIVAAFLRGEKQKA
jgi:hypothetical protein